MEEALEIYLLSYFGLQHINSLPHRYQTINEPLFNSGFPATSKILLSFEKIKQINMGTQKGLSYETLQGLFSPPWDSSARVSHDSTADTAAADPDLLTWDAVARWENLLIQVECTRFQEHCHVKH